MVGFPNFGYPHEAEMFTSTNFCRWHNHLNPDIKKDAWTLEEELELMNAHRIHGNKWAEIAKVLPGRYQIYLFFYGIYLECLQLVMHFLK